MFLRQRYLESTEAVNRSLNDDKAKVHNTLLPPGEGNEKVMRKSTSFQDAQIASVAQLLDVVRDLEKAHYAFQKMETERERNSLKSGKGSEPLIVHSSKRNSHAKVHTKELKEEEVQHES